jgi:hypothetical protein
VILLLGLPALAAVVVGYVALRCSKQSRVDLAAKLLLSTWVLVTATIVTAAALYSVAWMVPAERALWCRRVFGHSVDHRPIAGFVLLGILAFVAVRAGWITRKILRMWRAEAIGRTPLDIEESDEVYAFAVPRLFSGRGRSGGSIVVSTGMLSALSADEHSALFAHERAHLGFAHHRYLLTGQILVAVLPPLRPLMDRLNWLLERWADEAAAREIGNRDVVATAIAHAALSSTDRPSSMFLAFGSDSVVARVEALLEPKQAPSVRADRLLASSAVAASLAALTQLHHLFEVVQQLAR